MHLSQVHQPSKLFCVFCVFRGNILSSHRIHGIHRIDWQRVSSHRFHRFSQNGLAEMFSHRIHGIHRIDWQRYSPTDFTDSHRWCVFGVL